MLFTVFSTEVMDQMRDDMARQEVPAVFRVMVFGMPWFIVTAFLHSLVTLVSSIGLLRRRDWARRVFIVLMVLATVAIIDFLSTRIRLAVIGTRSA